MSAEGKHLIPSFNHGCVGFKYRQNNGGVKREQAMTTGNFPQPTRAPGANIYLGDLPTQAHYKHTSSFL